MILQELLDRAEELATNVAIDASHSPLIDSEVTAFTVYPHAVRAAIRDAVRLGKRLDSLTMEHLIELADGEGILPDTVIRECLNQASFPQKTFGAMVPFEDYQRYRFDNAMCYAAVRGEKFFWSCPVPKVTREIALAETDGTTTFTIDDASLTDADVGKRFAFYHEGLGLWSFDGIIDTVVDASNGTLRGKPLLNTLAQVPSATISDTSDDILLRSIPEGVTTIGSPTVSAPGSPFSAADVGRRLKATQLVGGAIVVDAIIDTFVGVSQVTLRGTPLSNETDANFAIYYSPLLLQSPGIPATPATLTGDVPLSPEFANDVILKIALVLRGEIPLQALIEGNYGRKK